MLASQFHLLGHHIQANVIFRLKFIQQVCAVTRAAADLQHILALQVQPHSAEHGHFKKTLSQFAGERLHGAKFWGGKFHNLNTFVSIKKFSPSLMKERGETLRCLYQSHGLQHLFIAGELEFFQSAFLCLFSLHRLEPPNIFLGDDRLAQ